MELDDGPVPAPDLAEDWRKHYIYNLLWDTLPADRTEARRLARHAKSYVLIDRQLYKQSHTRILQRCIPIERGRQLLANIHSGVCRHHATPRTLVRKAFRQGFYWPTAVADADQIVRTCEGCQFMLGRPTYWLKRSKPSPSRGPLRYGDWTWLDP